MFNLLAEYAAQFKDATVKQQGVIFDVGQEDVIVDQLCANNMVL